MNFSFSVVDRLLMRTFFIFQMLFSMGSFASDQFAEEEVFRSQESGLVAYLKVVNFDAHGIPDTFVLRVANNSENTNYSIILPEDQKLVTGFIMMDESSNRISIDKPLPRGSYEYLDKPHEIRELVPGSETEIDLSLKTPIQESSFENSREVYTRASFRIPYRIENQVEFEFIIAIFRSGKIVLKR